MVACGGCGTHHTAHCNTLQHTATHCNTLQHTSSQNNHWHDSINKAMRYSLLHLECHSSSISNPNLIGFFSRERGRKDQENSMIDSDLRKKKRHWKYTRLYSPLHLECHSILISNLNLLGHLSTERGKRDPEN